MQGNAHVFSQSHLQIPYFESEHEKASPISNSHSSSSQGQNKRKPRQLERKESCPKLAYLILKRPQRHCPRQIVSMIYDPFYAPIYLIFGSFTNITFWFLICFFTFVGNK